jgi:thiol-disulfide isomerase/thioredoxin
VHPTRPAALALTLLLSVPALAACGGDDATTAADEPASSSAESAPTSDSAEPSATPSPTKQASRTAEASPEPQPGRYVDWSEYEGDQKAYADGDVVLFFHAPWCHECRGTEESIAADGVPDGLTVVKVDFDSRTDLRQRYGVTVQHTFVQVDPSGEKVAAWTGSRTGSDIAKATT